MKDYLCFIVFMLLFGITLIGQQKANFKSSYTPKFVPSKNSLYKIKKGQKYQFGYLEVPENRSDPDSKFIKLPIYIFKSRNPNPKPDPIIYTVGGPGATTMPSAQYMAYYSYLEDRDFILFEQRGNYYAKPHLNCPEWSEARYQVNLPGFDERKADSLFTSAAKSCRERLLQQGIDLNGYHTNEIAGDIADLKKALGLDTYNLLTTSYSTKIAQVLLRDYPGGIRSVVMDSPLPLEVNYDEESVSNLVEGLQKLFSDCEQEAECNQAFPDIGTRFWDYLLSITEKPLIIEILTPKTEQKSIFRLKGKDLIGVISDMSTGEIPNMLLEIEKLLAKDFSTVIQNLKQQLEGPRYDDGLGMRLSVWCAEEFPFVSSAVVEEETNKYPSIKGLSPAVFKDCVCKAWNVKGLSEVENQAIKTDIPVLLISGSYDFTTPVKWAERMRKNLPNSQHLVFPGWGHTPTTNWSNPCGMEVARTFFNHPFVKPEPTCFQEMEPIKFKVKQ